jgi:hypothetical protein
LFIGVWLLFLREKAGRGNARSWQQLVARLGRSATRGFLSVFCTSVEAHAMTTIDQYQKDMHGPELQKDFTLIYIKGLLEGFEWMNIAIQAEGKMSPIFCTPPKLAITTEQAVDMLNRYLKDHNTKASDPIEIYLLDALKETFPCNPP